jgi:hypothetical protein
MKQKQHYKPGERKISETFLRFAAPILQNMPEGATPSEIENVLTVPCAIWNALVFDRAGGTQEYITRVRETIAHSPTGAAIAEDLIERKQAHFADDLRLIGKYGVKKRGPGEINLWAAARDPYSAIEKQGKPNKPSEATQ